MWRYVISYISRQPVLGYGYSGFWLGATHESSEIERALNEPILYSHNGYLEILVNLGAVGFFLAFGFLATGIKRAFYWSKRSGSSKDCWPLAFLFFLLYNLTECTILLQDLEWAVCVATVVGTDRALFAPDAELEEELVFVPSEGTT